MIYTLLRRVEEARYSGKPTAYDRSRDLMMLSDLIDSLVGKNSSRRSLSAAALQFANPGPRAVCLVIAYGAGSGLRGQRRFLRSPRRRLSQRKSAPTPLSARPCELWRSRRARKVAQPRLVQRDVTYRPSTDMIIPIDLRATCRAKAQRCQSAVKTTSSSSAAHGELRRRSASDQPCLAVRLTTDYDALIAYLKELETLGNTAVGKSMLTGIAHFMNKHRGSGHRAEGARDLRIKKCKSFKDQGLSAALDYAKTSPIVKRSCGPSAPRSWSCSLMASPIRGLLRLPLISQIAGRGLHGLYRRRQTAQVPDA